MSFSFFRVNHANIRISGVPNIHLTQKPLRKRTFNPGWRMDYLTGWNIMCVLIFAYALFTFISHVLIFTYAAFETLIYAAFETLIYSKENTRDILGVKKFLRRFFSLNVPFWCTCSCLTYFVPFSFTQKLYARMNQPLLQH